MLNKKNKHLSMPKLKTTFTTHFALCLSISSNKTDSLQDMQGDTLPQNCGLDWITVVLT